MNSDAIMVVKVGGSLYDQPGLSLGLIDWLHKVNYPKILLVPGGGDAANVVRSWHRIHSFSELQSHWLAIQSLTLTAHFLHQLLPGSIILQNIEQEWHGTAILDCEPILRHWEQLGWQSAHDWNWTSDSLAAWVAVRLQAERLYLLKSIKIPEEIDWQSAANAGYVDLHFPGIIDCFQGEVIAVNFTEWLTPIPVER